MSASRPGDELPEEETFEPAGRDQLLDPLPWHVDPHEALGNHLDLGVMPRICRGRWTEIPQETLHELVRLRIEVFVIEAGRSHQELDELDLAPTTTHFWIPDDTGAVAYLRAVRDRSSAVLVDRACSRPDVRHLGLTSALVTDVIARHGGGVVRALTPPDAMPFFLRHGFAVSGRLLQLPAGPRLPMERNPDLPWW